MNEQLMESPHRAPTAWLICADERMFRFFEIELAHLGLVALKEPSTEEAPCLMILDTQTVSVEEMLAKTYLPACPILAYGYGTVEISEERGIYLRRPFSLSELETTLRRLTAPVTTTAAPLARAHSSPVSTDNDTLELSPATYSLSVGGHTVQLTPAEWAILACLHARRGETVGREELATLLQGGGNSVDVYVCHLRRKIEKPLGRRMIETVRGKGYRLQ